MKRFWSILKKQKVAYFAMLFFLVPLLSHAASFNYQLLEDFPGVSGMKAGTSYTDMLGMINALYKFGIWTVGIAALLMLVIGGFMYMTSAGNTSRVASAKGVIGDALLGILAALGAYLLLYVINPDLTKLNLKLIQVNVQGGAGGSGTGGTAGNGTPSPVTPGNGSGAGAVTKAQAMMQSGCGYCHMSPAPVNPSGCSRNSCGGNPAYTDCSDFVSTAYAKAGCSSPGTTSSAIAANSQSITGGASSLKAGDILCVPGHVVMCETDGCTSEIGASGVDVGIVEKSNVSYYIGQGATVVPAANYCQ